MIDLPKLIAAYYTEVPDPGVREERVQFGTSGHRGSSLRRSFNEMHILAMAQAICLYRAEKGIDGPLYLGIDTHALSQPALQSSLEVLAANGVKVVVSKDDEFTPTPVISRAILVYNRGRKEHLADGIVITPSHNPPDEGGFKYNPPNGGPAEPAITSWIEKKANEFLLGGGILRIPYEKALKLVTRENLREAYIEDLQNILNFDAIRSSNLKLGVDPMGGAGVHYWRLIGERYRLNLTVVSEKVDPTFSFMPLDWDGKIRMDPSSPDAMRNLIGLKNSFDIAFACDTDHDRHGIVTKSQGLMPSNHYLSACIYYLFQNRPEWKNSLSVGKTVVSSSMIDKVAGSRDRSVYEVPVGFKWFVDGLFNGTLGFVGEESAGASFLRKDGSVWTTDKDGIIAALLAAEMTAVYKKDPSQIYQELTHRFGTPLYDRFEAPATPEQKDKLKKLSPEMIKGVDLAGEKILSILTRAPGNGAPIDGVKVISESGWFAARPSGTENIYKIYAESFKDETHLKSILREAQTLVNEALK